MTPPVAFRARLAAALGRLGALLLRRRRPAELRLPAVRGPHAILVLQLAGLDEIADTAAPERAFITLRDLHEKLTQAIAWHNGTVVAQDGGRLSATMNAVEAMNAARAVLRRIADLNRQRRLLRLSPIGIALGLHHGAVTTGQVGARAMALGAAMTQAERLARLATEHDARLIASSAFIQALRAEGADLNSAIADLTPMPGVAAGQLLFMLPRAEGVAAPRIVLPEAAERPTLH